MKNNTYIFNKKPEDHQPSGHCDFSKIYTPNTLIITYTNLNTRETECHTIERTEIIDDNGIKKMAYYFPNPVI